MNEFDLIAKLSRRFTKNSPAIEVGIGDDAAVVAAGGGIRWAFTTDALVEGVHFDRAYGTARQLGHKALAVNLSDLAAMGADPRYALFALGLPEEIDPEGDTLDELIEGLAALAERYRVSVVGGNVSRSPVLTLTITAVGDIAGPPLERRGGSPGDALVVTGPLGSAALGLELLRAGRTDLDDDERELVQRQLAPEPRVAVGQALRLMASAGIDVSDGLAQDAGHLARASRCGARLELAKLPLSPAYERLTSELDDPWHPALAGGEDYELLLAVPPAMLRTAQLTAGAAGSLLFEIGRLVPGEGVVVVAPDGSERPAPEGWRHV